MANLIYLDRLLQLYDLSDTIVEGIPTLQEVMASDEVSKYVQLKNRVHYPRQWHLGRIKHFVLAFQTGQRVTPIDIDDPCSFGDFTGYPIIVDGHHRAIAAHLAGVERIHCEFNGLIATLHYLQGKRKTFSPEG